MIQNQPRIALAATALLCLAGWSAVLAAPVAGAADGPPDPTAIKWRQYWREIAGNYCAIAGKDGDTFYPVPNYRKEFPSSVLIGGERTTATKFAAAEVLNQTLKSSRDQPENRTLRKPKEEVAAAVEMIPAAAAGEYGKIVSAKVEKIIDADEVLLGEMWLADESAVANERQKWIDKLKADVADKDGELDKIYLAQRDWAKKAGIMTAYRSAAREALNWYFQERESLVDFQNTDEFRGLKWHVVGFKTDKMVAGSRWPSGGGGVSLVVLAETDDGVIAAPTALLERGLTEEQVSRLLISRGLDQAGYVDLVQNAKRADPKNWLALVLQALENGGKLPGVAAKPAATPAGPAPAPAPKGNDVELAP